MVIAWQTDESAPNASSYKVVLRGNENERRSVVPSARVIDNYLAADPTLPTIPGAYGPHSNYTAVLGGLTYDTEYHYVVTCPGMPSGGLSPSLHTRETLPRFSFSVS